ncbi:MAG TPA: translesion error-prone DNA polymerase V autoproteolytic subunit [Ktedonobacteraceae bacterium]|jgi:DNA polymerase V|nr:translesion error-prone DNA polymerase V autoproteolytic subunit [Ktedonobacteraceae bacterium]
MYPKVLPLLKGIISCGFPSPADDYAERRLDLDELVVAHPEATFYVRVTGDSMNRAAIYDGDILVVDRAQTPAHNNIVVAILNGAFTVKRLYLKGDTVYLLPANPAYKPVRVESGMDFQIWGVVTYCIHRVR